MPEADGLQKGIAETLIQTGVSHKIGMDVGIPQGENLFPPDPGTAWLEVGSGVDQGHVSVPGLLLELMQVTHPLVAGVVGDDQDRLFAQSLPIVGFSEATHQLDGHLDTLARHDSCGLQDHQVVIGEAQGISQAIVEGVRAGRAFDGALGGWYAEVEHVGHNRGFDASPCLQIPLGWRVDDDVAHLWGVEGEVGVQELRDAVATEARSLPVEVVMVGDGGQLCLGDEFRQG